MQNHRRVQLAIAIGGAAGAYVRIGADQLIGPPGSGWPWATFAVNMVGSALLGWVIVRLPFGSLRRPALTIGFCGALTTFSTLQVELLNMLRHGDVALAVGYGLVSLAVGFAALMTASRIGRRQAVVA